MKLYEIRTALQNLVHINKDLTKDRLTTFLQAAGWNLDDIKDATLMWETNSFGDSSNTAPVLSSTDLILKEEILPTTDLLDNTTTIFAETSLSRELNNPKEEKTEEKKEEKSIEKLIETPTEKVGTVEEIKVTPQESIIPKEGVKILTETPPSVFEHISKETPHDELPHNLPLRPYESSFVTVPLNEYEKRFASHVNSRIDTMETHKANINGSSVQVENKTPQKESKPAVEYVRPIYVDKVVEAPLETEDKYLVFIAIVLFILIMFILGYMKISGRL